MDEAGVKMMVDLDGQWGENLREEVARYQEALPDRFVVFSGIDYDNFGDDPEFGETEVADVSGSQWPLGHVDSRSGNFSVYIYAITKGN